MTLAIMQPYFLPYIGYWQLMDAVDTFVVYDNVEFSKNGWFHRNNILLNGEKSLFTIPLQKDSDTLDVNRRFLADNAAKEIHKIVRRIENAYRKAPYYDEVAPMLYDIFLHDEKNLFAYIFYAIKKIAHYLRIETKLVVSSSINEEESLRAQERVIAINKALGAAKYINMLGGEALYTKEAFAKEGIALSFLKTQMPHYKQFENEFVPFLSIIDVMMFNSVDSIREMLLRYDLL